MHDIHDIHHERQQSIYVEDLNLKAVINIMIIHKVH